MVGFPNKPMGFPTKIDHDLECEMGVFPPFKETSIFFFAVQLEVLHPTSMGVSKNRATPISHPKC